MYDLVIVGGGIAGMCAALAAPEGARIIVIDKGEAGAGSSPLAQGGLAAAVGPEDSPELHAKDTIVAGAGICDERTVEDICGEGPAAVEWLVSLGCEFDRTQDGSLDLAREGGQSVARSVHQRDATGQDIVRALRAAVRDRKVERVQTAAAQLFVSEGRCEGVHAGSYYGARAVLLATGGAGGLWGKTTNAPGATGDGLVLALEAGAQLADLEFMQFHPTALDDGTAGQRILLTEALRGDGAVLVDERGERFVDELAPRHVVAKAILDKGGAFLDCRGIGDLEKRFPTVVSGARSRGFDPIMQPLPVYPAAHYFIGGVAADAFGRTSIPDLFAAGEAAATGMHGANRLAGNSLLETVVVGKRVGAAIARAHSPADRDVDSPLLDVEAPAGQIASIMWSGVGPIRNEEGLRNSITELERLRSRHAELGTMIARAALARPESRGVHIRSDFPEPDPSFAVRSFDRHVARVRD